MGDKEEEDEIVYLQTKIEKFFFLFKLLNINEFLLNVHSI
jgi:hypothetical protein